MRCPCCARRDLLLASLALGGTLGNIPAAAFAEASRSSPAEAVLAAKLSRPEWIDELYTWLIGVSGDTYDDVIKSYKDQLLGLELRQKIQQQEQGSSGTFQIVELGIGTGKNFQYFVGPKVQVTGVDPSRAAEKYARTAAAAAGLRQDQFEFVQGVGEGLPLERDRIVAES